MQLVIPLKSDNRYEQLRLALRSICTHHDITDCVVVGGKPKWYTGKHIPFKDYGPVQAGENIRDKTIAGAELVQGEFMFANDDHILLEPLTETYNKGLLSGCLAQRRGNGTYTRLLRNTLDHYGDVPNIDTHCPMFMTTEGVQKTAFKWPLFGLGFKTVYAQENNLSSVYEEDCKVREYPAGRKWFSMVDNFNLEPLYKIFPVKSKFEV